MTEWPEEGDRSQEPGEGGSISSDATRNAAPQQNAIE